MLFHYPYFRKFSIPFLDLVAKILDLRDGHPAVLTNSWPVTFAEEP